MNPTESSCEKLSIPTMKCTCLVSHLLTSASLVWFLRIPSISKTRTMDKPTRRWIRASEWKCGACDHSNYTHEYHGAAGEVIVCMNHKEMMHCPYCEDLTWHSYKGYESDSEYRYNEEHMFHTEDDCWCQTN